VRAEHAAADVHALKYQALKYQALKYLAVAAGRPHS
jgi:hypothetical protein